jgi:hypothetical protein
MSMFSSFDGEIVTDPAVRGSRMRQGSRDGMPVQLTGRTRNLSTSGEPRQDEYEANFPGGYAEWFAGRDLFAEAEGSRPAHSTDL